MLSEHHHTHMYEKLKISQRLKYSDLNCDIRQKHIGPNTHLNEIVSQKPSSTTAFELSCMIVRKVT